MTLADTGASEAAAAVGDKAADAVASGAAAVQGATDAAAAAVQRDNGWFGFFTGPFESVLKARMRAQSSEAWSIFRTVQQRRCWLSLFRPRTSEGCAVAAASLAPVS